MESLLEVLGIELLIALSIMFNKGEIKQYHERQLEILMLITILGILYTITMVIIGR